MRAIIFIVFSIFILISCKNEGQKHYVQVQAPENSDEEIVFKLSREQGGQHWTIERLDKTDYQFPDDFSDKLLESFESCPSCYDITDDSIREQTLKISLSSQSSDYFETRDMNFDGDFDIAFASPATCCSGKNVLQEVWIYDKARRTFVYNNEISQGCLWDYNEKKKTLVIGWSLEANNYSSSTYKSNNGTLIEVQREFVEPYNDSLLQVITEKLTDGKWISDTTFENL